MCADRLQAPPLLLLLLYHNWSNTEESLCATSFIISRKFKPLKPGPLVGILTPAPPPNYNKNKSQLPLIALSSHFLTCFGTTQLPPESLIMSLVKSLHILLVPIGIISLDIAKNTGWGFMPPLQGDCNKGRSRCWINNQPCATIHNIKKKITTLNLDQTITVIWRISKTSSF